MVSSAYDLIHFVLFPPFKKFVFFFIMRFYRYRDSPLHVAFLPPSSPSPHAFPHFITIVESFRNKEMIHFILKIQCVLFILILLCLFPVCINPKEESDVSKNKERKCLEIQSVSQNRLFDFLIGFVVLFGLERGRIKDWALAKGPE